MNSSSFRPISPLQSLSNVPNHTMGGRTERFEDTKEIKLNSALGPGSYDLRLVSYERRSSRSPIYPYEMVSSPKMYHQTLPSSLIPIAQAPPVGTYEIQRWGSPSIVPPAYSQSDKNTYSFNNKSRQQALGSSTCHGESKFFNESKWDIKCKDFSPGPGSYDVSSSSVWSKRNSPTSVTDRVSSPIPRNTNHSKPWNDYKQQQQQQQVSSLLNSPKTTIRKMSKSEMLEIQDEIDSVKRLPIITYL